MKGKRVLSIVGAMALLLGMVIGGLLPAPVAAQADELSQRDFADLVETVQEDDAVFGPEDGELEHDPEIVTMVYAEQELADLLATVTMANPYAGRSQQFDYGIQVRTFSEDDAVSYLRFIVVSTGQWGISDAEGEFLLTGEYEDLDLGRNGENELTIYAEGPLVHLGINGDYVGSVEVELEEVGDVAVGTSFFAESYDEGAVTEFTDFTVWEIGGTGRSTDSGDEDEQADDDSGDSGDDRGPLGPLGGNDDEGEPTEEARDDGPSRDDEDEPTPESEDEPTAEPEDGDEQGRDDDEDSGTGVGGTVYESPTYGYTLQYDDSVWSVESEESADGVDVLGLTTDLSFMTISGMITELPTEECLATYVGAFAQFLEDDGGIELSLDDEGEIARGPLAGAFYAETSYSNDGQETTVYFLCGRLDGGEVSIMVRHFVASAAFADESDPREEILDTISLDGQPSDSGDDDEPARDDEDEAEPTREPEDGDEPARDDEDEPAQDGALYESPSHGYSLRYDDDIWEVTSESSDEALDTLVLDNGISTLSFFGFPSVESPEACLEVLLNSLIRSFEDGGIAGEFAAADSGEVSGGSFDGAGFIEGIFTAETDDGGSSLAIYAACGPVSGSGSEFYLGVRHFALADAYEGEAELRDEIMASILGEGEAPADSGDDGEPVEDEGDEPSRDDNDDDNVTGSGNIDSPSVSRVDGANIYTSPTYGFTVEIQRGFSVEQDTVEGGYDTLVIANENARITVAGFASSNSATTCVDSIITNLTNDPSFTSANVLVDEQGAPIRIDDEGFSAVPVFLTFNQNGEEVEIGRLYACFSFTGVNGGSATLVYAYETPADIFIDEFDNIVATLDLIFVP